MMNQRQSILNSTLFQQRNSLLTVPQVDPRSSITQPVRSNVWEPAPAPAPNNDGAKQTTQTNSQPK